MKICPEGFSDKEMIRIKEFLLEDALPSILESIDDVDDVEQLQDVLELLGRARSDFGYLVSSEENEVEKRIEALLEPPERDDDDIEPDWDGPVTRVVDPDAVIDEMFDSLKRHPYDE